MKLVNPFTREFWIADEDVREAVGPLPERDAINQARCSAIALEADREQLRADLLRRWQENSDERQRINEALDALDTMRVLETPT